MDSLKLIKTYRVKPQHFNQSSFDMHLAYSEENNQYRASSLTPLLSNGVMRLKLIKFDGDTEDEAFNRMERWIKHESGMGPNTEITEKPPKDESETE